MSTGTAVAIHRGDHVDRKVESEGRGVVELDRVDEQVVSTTLVGIS